MNKTKKEPYNDEPITHPDDDFYGADPFARALAKRIEHLEGAVGSTIAINGAWRS